MGRTWEGIIPYLSRLSIETMGTEVGNWNLLVDTKERNGKKTALSRVWKSIILGIVAAIVITIVLLVMLASNHHNDKANTTVDLLKKCLNDMEISVNMTELIVPSNRCNEKEFKTLDLGEFKKLKRLEIGSYSFENVDMVRLHQMRELESVTTTRCAFSKRLGSLSISDCNNLKEVVFEERSFSFFKSFEVKDTPKLNSIVIGNNCFGNVENVELSMMPSLGNVTIGENSFIGKNGSLTLSECNRLESLQIGTGSFMNYTGFTVGFSSLRDLSIGSNCFRECDHVNLVQLKSLERVKIGANSFSHKQGSFVVKDCPSLKELTMGEYAFYMYAGFEIQNAPLLDTLDIGSYCFARWARVEVHGLSSLKKWIVDPNSFGGGGELSISDCPSMTELLFADGTFGWFDKLSIRSMDSLEAIHIGSNAFWGVQVVKLDSLPKLAVLSIGNESFGGEKGRFSINKCDELRELRIGNNSFSNYNSLDINSNKALELVELGVSAFSAASSFELTGFL